MADQKFSKTIRRARALRGLTQSELATQAGISRQALAAIEAGSYLPNVAIAVRLARVIGITVEELFGDADEDREQRIDARWKKSPVATANRKRVILARVGGRMVALAQPSACLTLPVSSGIRMKTAGSQARISTRLLDDEIDGTLIVAGCDPAVALLIGWMARTGSRINAVALPCSSGRALAALADGSVHVAGAHLRDPKSGDYNLAPVRSAIGRGRICVVNFARWEVGLVTAGGNPRGIRNFCDLARHDIRIVNRERGSGARQVLDEALSEADLKPKQIVGYQDEVPGHLDVAAAVQSGGADAGVTIRVAAEAYGLGFIPLREERYDLAIPETELASAPVSRMLDALKSRRFAREVAQLCAYDTTRMGEELARIES
jgi:putative molybdopterin biosynthesis protein